MLLLGVATFNESHMLLKMLCGKRHTWNVNGQIYRTCVKPVMTYGSKTWVVRSLEESILRRAEKRMLRMMCGVQLADGVSTKELMVRLGLDNTIVEVVRQGSLRWLEHVVKKRDKNCVKQAWRFEVENSRRGGRLLKWWKPRRGGESICVVYKRLVGRPTLNLLQTESLDISILVVGMMRALVV